MKFLLSFLLVVAFAFTSYADIQDPPMNDMGPTRKLSRGLSNVIFGITELPNTIGQINEREGNSAAASYGIIKGVGSVFFRFGKGVYEIVTFPFPTYKGSYRPPYRLSVPWIHGGHTEFPPELGWESKYTYVRENTGY